MDEEVVCCAIANPRSTSLLGIGEGREQSMQ